VSEAVAIIRNTFNPDKEVTPGEIRSVEDEALKEVENYVQGHDVLLKLPGATLNLSPRHLDDNELTMTLKFDNKKSKAATVVEGNTVDQWFPKWVVPPPGGRWDYRYGR
jgi:hypothetical protein